MNVEINITEAASKLADERVKNNFRYSAKIVLDKELNMEEIEDYIYKKDDEGNTSYIEKAQEVFDGFYDMFYDILINCSTNKKDSNEN